MYLFFILLSIMYFTLQTILIIIVTGFITKQMSGLAQHPFLAASYPLFLFSQLPLFPLFLAKPIPHILPLWTKKLTVKFSF